MIYQSLEHMIAAVVEAGAPPESMSVTEAAQKYVTIRQPGAHVGKWSPTKTPYLLEPQDILTSLDYDGMIFVGPARTGKSQMFQNWLAHTSKTDPTDMMVVHMTQPSGREWSKSDLEKLFKHSPDIKALLKPGRQNDNTFDKEFISGMRLEITWPTANNLSGKTKRYVWLMDYDRMPPSIDGEGNAYDLGKKRAETFKRFGMTVAESSPNPAKEIDNPKWTRPHQHSHMAPPIRGIFELYNRGDRRLWMWRCPQCRETFEPTFDRFDYPDSADIMESAEQVTLICPHDGFPMTPAMKDELNGSGRWVREGMIWMPDGSMIARPDMKPARSNIASFWMKGPSAAFQDWKSLVLEYLRAEQAYEATGDEEPLKKTITTDQGGYYIPKARQSERLPEDLKAEAEDWGATEAVPTVPFGVRFLVATVDVQARAFVVQVKGFTADGDMVIIDGFKIRKSDRRDADGDPLPLDPASFGEDWDLLIDQVILKSYPLADGTGRMHIKLTGGDSGGREGVTHQAYAFWRRLRDDPEARGLHRRFALVKGDGSINAPRVQVTWPDSNRRDAYAVARGDVPVIRFNSNLLKDQIAAMLGRRIEQGGEQGGGMIRFPKWMPDWFYVQMTTEVRTPKGWDTPSKKRNESWDLAYYALGLVIRTHDHTVPIAAIALNSIDWTKPPGWAAEWPDNDLVALNEAPDRFREAKPKRSFADLARELA